MVELRLTASVRIHRLLARIRNAEKSNLRSRGLLATGDKPVVTSSTTAPSSATYAGFPSAPTSAADWAPYVAVLGGWLTRNSNFVFQTCITRTLGQPTGGGSAVSYQGACRNQFYSDGPTCAFTLTGSTKKFRVIVDGQYESLTGFANASSGSVEYWTLDFSACTTPRKRRKIEIDIGGDTTVLQLGRVYAEKTATITAPSAEEIGPRVIISSDSFGIGVGATDTQDGFARYAGDIMGFDDVWTEGRSSGSWACGINSDAGPSALEAVTDVTAWAPDWVICALGYNANALDGLTRRAGVVSPALEAGAAAAALTAYRAALPNVPITVAGGGWRSGTVTARNRQSSYEAAILAAVPSDPLIKSFPWNAVQTGTGRVGATVGDGNSDFYIGADNTHPTDAGHEFIARTISTLAKNSLLQMST